MSFNTLIDVNKYLYNTNNTDDTIGFNNNNDKMRDINLIEIYIINTNKGKHDNIIDVSLSSRNNLESFIDNYYKKSRVEKYKSYTHKERVYTYELSNDNQYVSSKIKKNIDIIENILVICSKNDKQPNYTFPCTNDIDNITEYILKEYKISNRISLIMRSDIIDNVNNKEIKTLYIEYRHSNNVDTDKINDTINKIIKKILSQSK
jgi:hypothetical protein